MMVRDHRLPSGFTLIELLVSLVVASVVLAGAYGLLVGQVGSYRTHQDRADARLALRSAMALLTWELRHASPAGGDLYMIDSASVTVRTVLASGIVCRKHATAPRFGITRVTGEWQGAGSDSVTVFGAGAAVSQDDAWHVMPLAALATPAAFGVDTCSWTTGESPSLALEVTPTVAADTASVRVGAPVRLFRTYQYGTHVHSGETWLSRTGPGSATPTQLAGPLTADGVLLEYYDAAGAMTADSSLVRSIQVTLRTVRPADGGGLSTDSLVSRITLRN